MHSTQDKIIVHAATLYAENGCKAITMDDIANSLGMSKRTIYENFPDKATLLKACLNYFFEQHELDIQQILQSSDNIIGAIFKILENTSNLFFRIKFDFINEIHKYYPDVYSSTVEHFTQKYLESTNKMLQKGQQDGIVRKDLDTMVLSVLFNEVSIWIVHKDIFADYGIHKKSAMHTCMSCITRGMFTEKGLHILDEHIEEFKKIKDDYTN